VLNRLKERNSDIENGGYCANIHTTTFCWKLFWQARFWLLQYLLVGGTERAHFSQNVVLMLIQNSIRKNIKVWKITVASTINVS